MMNYCIFLVFNFKIFVIYFFVVVVVFFCFGILNFSNIIRDVDYL